MRFDKFTTKLQEALGEAQSLALGQDHQQIEPQHLLLALLNQEDGGVASLIAKAGGNPNALKQALTQAIGRLLETLKREQVNLFYAKAPAEFGVIEAAPAVPRARG